MLTSIQKWLGGVIVDAGSWIYWNAKDRQAKRKRMAVLSARTSGKGDE